MRIFLEDIDIFQGRKGDQLFIIIKIKEKEGINLIIKEIDQIIASYNFPALFFENYIPHISLISANFIEILEDVNKLNETKKLIKEIIKDYETKNFDVLISEVCCKVGERINYFKLK